MPGIEPFLERRLVNQPAARAIDDAHALLGLGEILGRQDVARLIRQRSVQRDEIGARQQRIEIGFLDTQFDRSEEHTSELQSLMRISYAVFCLKKQKQHTTPKHRNLLRLDKR